MPYGTLTTLDTLAAQSNQSIFQLGEDVVFNALALALEAHNALMNEKLAALTEETTDRFASYGGVEAMTMAELGEFGTPEAQKVGVGANIFFPLRRYGIGLQWTRMYFEQASAAQLQAQTTAVQDADARNIDLQIRKALFRATNYTATETLTDRASLAVKALVNADGSSIPLGQTGKSFDGSTHTHYLANASLTATVLNALIQTVAEHYAANDIEVWIPATAEATVTGLTGFAAVVPLGVTLGTNTAYADGGPLDAFNYSDRYIGRFNGARVWIKPGVPDNYIFAYNRLAPKTLKLRRKPNRAADLILEYQDEVHPLRAQALAREFGVAASERTNGAILYFAGGSYVVPTLT